MSVPDAIEPIVGYRAWYVGLGRLWSPLAPVRVPWPRGALRARCLKDWNWSLTRTTTPITHDHDVPGPACACGIYAMNEPWEIGPIGIVPPWCLVIGKVHAWGRVVLGKRGWRAEVALPVELIASPSWDERTRGTIELVANAYGLPLTGCCDPDSRRPGRCTSTARR